MFRPDRGEQADHRSDHEENDCPGESQGEDTIRRDVPDEVTVEQPGQEADETEHAEGDSSDVADRRPRVAHGQPGEDELCHPDRQRHRVLGVEAPCLVERVRTRGEGHESSDHVADQQDHHGDEESAPRGDRRR